MFQLLAGRAAVPEVTYPVIQWSSDFLPPEYALSQGGAAYARSGVDAGNNNLQNFVFADKYMRMNDLGEGYGYYWEIDLTGSAIFDGYHGVLDADAAELGYDQGTEPLADGMAYRGDGALFVDGVQVAAGLTSYGNGDTLMFAFDPLDGALWTGVNGTWDRQPWHDEPRGYAPLAGFQGLFVPTAQARAAIDAGVLRSRPADFTYTIPDGFISLSESNPNPTTRPQYWEFSAGTSELGHFVDFDRSSTFRSTTTLDTRYALGVRTIGGAPDPDVPVGGYYWELEVKSFLGTTEDVSAGLQPEISWAANGPPRMLQWRSDGRLYFNGSWAPPPIDTWTSSDRLMFCFNPHTGSLWLGKNGTWLDDPETDLPTYSYSVSLTSRWKVCVQHVAPSAPGELKEITIYALASELQYDIPENAVPLSQWV